MGFLKKRNEKHKKLSLQSHNINTQIPEASDHNNLNDFFKDYFPLACSRDTESFGI